MDTGSADRPFDFAVGDVEYLRHGAAPLLARLYVPRGEGPLAKSGIVAAALDFRQGRDGGRRSARPRAHCDQHRNTAAAQAVREAAARATELGPRAAVQLDDRRERIVSFCHAHL